MIPRDSQERQLLIAEHVLGLLSPEQAAEVERWLEQDDDAAQLASHWQAHWLGAAELLEPEPLPPGLWQRIERQTAEAGTRRRPFWQALWQSPSLWRTVSAGLLVAVVLLLGPLRVPAPVYTVVLQAPGEAASPGWRVTVSDRGDLQLTPLADSEYPVDRSVQFWTLADPAQGPRSLGLVNPGQPLVLPASRVGDVESGQLFELTLEPPGGSPADRPTGPVLFIGRAVAL